MFVSFLIWYRFWILILGNLTWTLFSLQKRKEQERLEKIKEKEKTNPNEALEQFAQMQKEKEEQVNKKLDSVSDNREKLLRERQQRQKERQRRAELVRQRKQLAAMDSNEQDENDVIPIGNQLAQ